MVFSRRTTAELDRLDVREAFNLWDFLKSKYDAIERFQLLQNLAHDKDLKALLGVYLRELNQNKEILEGLMQKYSVKGPDQNRPMMRIPVNVETVTDEIIALDAMKYVQEHMESLLRSQSTSDTNEEIRSALARMLKKTVNEADAVYKYMKLKGWLDNPPMYRNVPASTTEAICTGGVGALWQHLTFRYDNLHQTRIYHAFVQDGDFKLLLQAGVRMLSQQIKILEKECEKFGLPLPKKPAEVLPTAGNKELLSDDHMYRMVLMGMQVASLLHSDALKVSVVNDRVRDMFRRMLLEELDFHDKLVKYGKVKGWIHPAPIYKS